MAYLLDTSILARLANLADAMNPIATQAVFELHSRGEVLHITAQNLIEFRNVATRPKIVNGLGISPANAEAIAAAFEAKFPLLVETQDVFPKWKTIVRAQAVVGKRVHDARLVAICHVHSITHLLTFNISHFLSLAQVLPGVVEVDPTTV